MSITCELEDQLIVFGRIVRKIVTENELHVPPSYIEKEMAYNMAEALLPYIEFERYLDHNGLVIQGKIRIATRV